MSPTQPRSQSRHHHVGTSRRTHALAALAVHALAFASTASAQDHEPMSIQGVLRETTAEAGPDLQDPDGHQRSADFGTDPGTWAGLATATGPDAKAVATQWTRLRPDRIGGWWSCESASLEASEAAAESRLDVVFEIERTGWLRIETSSGGDAHGAEKIAARWKVERVGTDECVALLVHRPDRPDTPSDQSAEVLLPAGRYRVIVDAHARVDSEPFDKKWSAVEMYGEMTVDRLPDCGEPGAGSCLRAKQTPSCEDGTCCKLVCDVDPYCCDHQWDEVCADAARGTCSLPCEGDLNGDGRVDHDDWMLLAHVAVYEPGEGPEAYDLDGDGDVDIHDLVEIYGLYGDC